MYICWLYFHYKIYIFEANPIQPTCTLELMMIEKQQSSLNYALIQLKPLQASAVFHAEFYSNGHVMQRLHEELSVQLHASVRMLYHV